MITEPEMKAVDSELMPRSKLLRRVHRSTGIVVITGIEENKAKQINRTGRVSDPSTQKQKQVNLCEFKVSLVYIRVQDQSVLP